MSFPCQLAPKFVNLLAGGAGVGSQCTDDEVTGNVWSALESEVSGFIGKDAEASNRLLRKAVTSSQVNKKQDFKLLW